MSLHQSSPPSAASLKESPTQPSADSVTRSDSNGTNAAIVLGHIGLFSAERSVNGYLWIPLSPVSKTETDSFHRLIARVCAGEIDPREHIADGSCSREIRLVALPG